VVGSGYVNADANPHLILQHDDGSLAAWFMDETAFLTGAPLTLARVADARLAAVGDMDNDSRPDLLFQHSDGHLELWLLDGVVQRRGSPLRIQQRGADLLASAGWQARALGDLNDDGRLDIVFQHTNGELGVWFMNIALVNDTLGLPDQSNASWQLRAAGDLDRDGATDLIFQNEDPADVAFFEAFAVWFMQPAEPPRLRLGMLLDPPKPAGEAGWGIAAPR
jgi:hypothetical protein